jgi:hypothetical protein
MVEPLTIRLKVVTENREHNFPFILPACMYGKGSATSQRISATWIANLLMKDKMEKKHHPSRLNIQFESRYFIKSPFISALIVKMK